MKAWAHIARYFEDLRVQKIHPAWHERLCTGALFDVDVPRDRMIESINRDQDIETQFSPLPYPVSIFATDEFVAVVANMTIEMSETSVEWACDLLYTFYPYGDDQDRAVAQAVYVLSGSVRGGFVGDEPWFVQEDATAVSGGSGGKYSAEMTSLLQERSQMRISDTFANVMTVLVYINAPQRFIIEEKPQRIPKVRRGQVPRIKQRSRYIVLDKSAIKTRYLAARAPSDRSPMPHLRRGHYRILQNPRFKSKGSRVWVRATHVKGNVVEWREGGRFYKVL